MPGVTIILNGEPRQIDEPVALDELLRRFGLPEQRVAVELNLSVVRRADWPGTIVGDRDKVEVVHFVGGG